MDPIIPTRTSSKHWQTTSSQSSSSARRQGQAPAFTRRSPPLANPPPPVYTGRPASRDHPLYSTWAASISPGVSSPEREQFRRFAQLQVVTGHCRRDASGKIDSQDLIARFKLLRQQDACLGSSSTAKTLKRKASSSELEGSQRLGAPPAYPSGTNISNAIDLTSPPRYSIMASTQHTYPPIRSSHVRQSSLSQASPVVLPPWQPDSEVTHCTSCSTEFGIMKRKHHCRKCGKVVCDACSRHRITMPSKYIVQPPEGASSSPFAFLSVPLVQQPNTNTSGDGIGSQNTTLRSSEAVRVCNPCVPDPNFSPPTQTPVTSPPSQPSHSVTPMRSPHHRSSRSQNYDNLAAMGYPFINARAQAPPGLGIGTPRIPPRNLRHETPGPPASSRAFPFPTYARRIPPTNNDPQQSQPLHLRRATMANPSTSSIAHPPHTYHAQTSFHPSVDFFPSHRHHGSHSHHRRPPLPPHLMPGSSSSTSIPQAGPPQRPQPRREIPEEDECPVCIKELPPIGPNGNETARLKHVEDCIKLYSTSAGSGGGSSIPAPNPVTNNSTSHTLTHTISASAPSSSSSSMPSHPTPTPGPHVSTANPAAVPRNHRLLRYVATEKDCVNASGEQQECVICMEDFEPGIEMARLDCFCTFHDACIKEWWGRKGVGSCPTHQVTL